ncbi:MAG: nucleotidyltransferase family protein [Tissierellia bacterium]|nr:nucleotidyltransferase family protein [Tissierellia bacterium]
MKILGIVAEYNPLHNGHIYHIKESINKVNPDAIVIIMSSSFTQRGEPAILDKWTRANHGLRAGGDLVLELPFRGAVSSAESFALSALSILNSIPCTHLSFGVESLRTEDEIYSKAKKIIEIKNNPRIKEFLKTGLSFHQCILQLSKEKYNDHFIQGANDLLALEYGQSAILLNYPLKLVPILRKGPIHGSSTLSSHFASGSEIRKRYFKELPIEEFCPPWVLKDLERNKNIKNYLKWEGLIPYFQLMILKELKYENYTGYEVGMENYIKEQILQKEINKPYLKETKRYSKSRLQRYLLHALLDIKKEKIRSHDMGGYIRPLAMNQIGREILREVKRQDKIVITQPARFLKKGSENIQLLLQEEILATNFYSILARGSFQLDFTHTPIIKTDKVRD